MCAVGDIKNVFYMPLFPRGDSVITLPNKEQGCSCRMACPLTCGTLPENKRDIGLNGIMTPKDYILEFGYCMGSNSILFFRDFHEENDYMNILLQVYMSKHLESLVNTFV